MDFELNGLTLLVCGPPASGKDTVSQQLFHTDNRFWHFQKHRGIVGEFPDNKASEQYINVSISEFENLIKQNEFIQYHKRYQRYYGISRHVLKETIDNGKIPVIHVGRIENLFELEEKIDTKTIKILIWAPLTLLENRLEERHPNDHGEINRRLQAANEEFSDLLNINLGKTFDIILKNDQSADLVVKKLFNLLQNPKANHEEVEELERYISQFN